MATALRIEERSQSGGTTITSRRDELLTIRVLAHRRAPPAPLTVQVLGVELQALGVRVTVDVAAAIARRILAAEGYRPAPSGEDRRR